MQLTVLLPLGHASSLPCVFHSKITPPKSQLGAAAVTSDAASGIKHVLFSVRAEKALGDVYGGEAMKRVMVQHH